MQDNKYPKQEPWIVKASEGLAKLPLFLVPARMLILILLFAGVILSAFGASGFKLKESMDSFFNKDDPQFMQYQWFKYLFGSDEFLLIMYEPNAENLFSFDAMKAIQDVENDLNHARQNPKSALSHITRVRSILSADYLDVEQNRLLNRPFIGSHLPKGDEDWNRLKKLAFEHPDFASRLFSKDESKAMLIINTDFGARVLSQQQQLSNTELEATSDEFDFGDLEQASQKVIEIDQVPVLEEVEMLQFTNFMREIRAVLNSHGWEEQQNIYMAGNPWIMDFFQTVILEELGMYFALSVLIIWLVLFAGFRSVSALIWPTVLLTLAMIILIGIIGWSGIEMTFMINIIVFLLLAICIASSIHIMSGYQICLREGMAPIEAIRSTFRRSGMPIILAAVTTALGLVSVIFVPILALRNFGIFASIGVLITLLLNLVLWPVFLSISPPRLNTSSSKQSYLSHFFNKHNDRIDKYKGIIYAVFSLVTISSILGIPKVYIDTNITQMIKPGYGVKESYETIDANFGGTSSVELLFNTGAQDGVKSHKLLSMMDTFASQLEQDYPKMITRVQSIVNPSKLAYKNLNGGDHQFFKVPESDRLVAQTLFSFESADPQTRRLMVDDNWQIARMTLSMKSHGTHEYEAFMQGLKDKASSYFDGLKKDFPEFEIRYTGSIPLMMHLVSLVSISQIRSFGLALAVISLVLFFIFGSLKLGLLAMIPNVFPLAVVMGYAGWLGIPMDSDTLLVMPIAIGIAVDDTIHFLSHYKSLLLRGVDSESALQDTFQKVGPAIVNTSFVLSFGFLIFIFSAHKPLNNFGVLSAIAIFSALLADLYLLPLLLRNINFRKGVGSVMSKTKPVSLVLIAYLLSFLLLTPIGLANTKTAVKELVQKVLDRNEGQSRYSQTVLISCDFKQGKNGKRTCATGLRKKVLESVSRDLDPKGLISRNLSVLIEPKIEAGLAFLQEDSDEKGVDSKQWLFLPDLKGKIKRVDSSGSGGPKTGTLFGSELSYEDIEKQHIDDYLYNFIDEATYDGKKVWIVESVPTKEKMVNVSYGKTKQWIDLEHFIALKAELYDKQGGLAKTLYNKAIKEVDKKRAKGVWIGTQLIVVNHKNQRMSMMKLRHVRLNISIPEGFPSVRALQEKSFRDGILAPLRQEKDHEN